MTAETDLLPLPEWAACDETVADMSTTDVREAMNDYARANVAHATAARDAEIEALRADRDSWEKQASDRVADWHAEHLRAEANRHRPGAREGGAA